jgi:replication initiation and membrane attachment protein DnaB
MKILFPAVWKYCTQQQFHNIVEEIMSVVSVLLDHEINNVKFFDSSNHHQYDLLNLDFLFELLRDIIARHVTLRRMMTFQSKPTLIDSEKSLKFIFLLGFENGHQLSAHFHPNAS